MICKSGLVAPKLHQTASWRGEISAVHASHKRDWYGEAKWQYFCNSLSCCSSDVLLLNLCAIDNLNFRHTVKPSMEWKTSSRLWIFYFPRRLFLQLGQVHSFHWFADCRHFCNRLPLLKPSRHPLASDKMQKLLSWTAERIFLREVSTRVSYLLLACFETITHRLCKIRILL